jgi:hypothetical protein
MTANDCSVGAFGHGKRNVGERRWFVVWMEVGGVQDFVHSCWKETP